MKVRVKNLDESLNLGTNQFDVRWWRNKISSPQDNNCKVNETVCTISLIDDNKKGRDKYTQIYSGKTVQGLKDNNNKHVSRKMSLRRALKDFPKEVRVQFWERYLEMCNCS